MYTCHNTQVGGTEVNYQESGLSPSVWVLRFELRFPVLVKSVFTELPHHPNGRTFKVFVLLLRFKNVKIKDLKMFICISILATCMYV